MVNPSLCHFLCLIFSTQRNATKCKTYPQFDIYNHNIFIIIYIHMIYNYDIMYAYIHNTFHLYIEHVPFIDVFIHPYLHFVPGLAMMAHSGPPSLQLLGLTLTPRDILLVVSCFDEMTADCVFPWGF